MAQRAPVKLGVLISGTGTNLQAIIDALERRELRAEIRLVISNRPGAQGLERAHRHGISTRVIEHRRFPSREDFDRALVDVLTEHGVELVVCAGFMRLLSPVMPFISEELWHAVYDGNPPARSIALTSYPAPNYQDIDSRAQSRMFLLQDLIRVAREERKNRDIPEREVVPMSVIESPNRDFGINPDELINQNADIVQKLAKISTITFRKRADVGNDDLSWRSIGFTEIALIHEKQIDVAAERDRLTKDIAKYEKGLAAAERQLGNEGFLAKAPAHVVEGLKKQEAETRSLLEKSRTALEALPPS